MPVPDQSLQARRRVASSAFALVAGLPALARAATSATVPAPGRHIVFQVSGADPAAMTHALSSADDAIKMFHGRSESVVVEIVANGAGVHMMRADTTPVGAMLHSIHETYPDPILGACGVTKATMGAKEGHPLTFVDGVESVPTGIVRIVELRERGCAYVKA